MSKNIYVTTKTSRGFSATVEILVINIKCIVYLFR